MPHLAVPSRAVPSRLSAAVRAQSYADDVRQPNNQDEPDASREARAFAGPSSLSGRVFAGELMRVGRFGALVLHIEPGFAAPRAFEVVAHVKAQFT
jgi:hypothetical protein